MALKNRPGKFIYKAIAMITIVWLACMIVVAAQYKETRKMSGNIVELGNSIMSFHNSLHFRSPYRVTHASDMSLNIQLIYSLRVQLEADYNSSWLQPDVTHLLYVIDKFIEKSQLFLTKELGILNMVEALKNQREHYKDQPELKQYYLDLGAYVFEALFTEEEQSPEIYRELDRMMLESQSLSDEDRQVLQLTLAKASKLLSEYAEGNNLVGRLLQHEIYRELYTVEQQYYQTFSRINVFVFALSILLIAALIIAVIVQNKMAINALQKELLDGKVQDKETASEPVKVINEVLSVEQENDTINSSIETKVDIQQMMTSLNGDIDSVKVLLGVFIEDHQQDAEKLEKFVEDDLDAAVRTAHSLKGVASTVGAKDLRTVAVEIEAKLKDGLKPSKEELYSLARELEETITGAKYWANQQSF